MPKGVTMRRALLSAVAAGLSAAALLVTGIAAAAVSPTYTVNGLSTAASSSQTSFFGSGFGSGGDRLLWQATVQHGPLGTDPSSPAAITGGSFELSSLAGRAGTTRLTGTFTGGTVIYDAAHSSPAPCGNAVYDVAADLSFDGWTGVLSVEVTVRSLRFFGMCFPLIATVSGAPGLTMTPASTGTEPPPPPPPSTPPPGEL
jgi:hypothetical protein